MRNGDLKNVRLYLEWASEYIQTVPERKIFEDMAKGYAYLKFQNEQCQIAKKGLYIYPKSDVLRKNSEECQRL